MGGLSAEEYIEMEPWFMAATVTPYISEHRRLGDDDKECVEKCSKITCWMNKMKCLGCACGVCEKPPNECGGCPAACCGAGNKQDASKVKGSTYKAIGVNGKDYADGKKPDW